METANEAPASGSGTTAMASNRRIQKLRERLEMYNATIAEAMGVVDASRSDAKAGSNGNGASSRATRGAPPPPPPPAEEEPATRPTKQASPTPSTRSTTTGSYTAPAPFRVARDLKGEFFAAGRTPAENMRQVPVNSMPPKAGASTKAPTTEARRGAPPPPPPPATSSEEREDTGAPPPPRGGRTAIGNIAMSNENSSDGRHPPGGASGQRRGDAASATRPGAEIHFDSSDDYSNAANATDPYRNRRNGSTNDSSSPCSDTSTSGFGEDEIMYPFLNELVVEEIGTGSIREYTTATGPALSGGGAAPRGQQRSVHVDSTAPVRGVATGDAAAAATKVFPSDTSSSLNETTSDSSSSSSSSSGFSLASSSSSLRGLSPVSPSVKARRKELEQDRQRRQRRYGPTEKAVENENVEATSAPSVKRESAGGRPQYTFEEFEVAFHRASAVDHAMRAFQSIMAPTTFPKPLPHLERGRHLAAERDVLIKREQELRARPEVEPGMDDFVAVGTRLNEEVASLIADCNEVKKLFGLIYDRKATLYAKDKRLQAKREELAKRQKEAQEEEAAMKQHDKRLQQRGVNLEKRAERFAADEKKHKDMEKALHKKLEEVESLGKRVSAWMRILKERDEQLAEKESRLHRVQSDLVRRSEGLVALKNSKVKSV